MKVSGSSRLLVREAKEGGAGGWKVSLKVNTGKAKLVRSRRLSMIHITLNRGGGEMENQKEPLLIRPSRTPKTNPQK